MSVFPSRSRPGGDDDGMEEEHYRELVRFFSTAPRPPDPIGLFPRFEELRARLRAALETKDELATEEALLTLYCHVHGHEAPLTPAERLRIDETGGYWCHAGGISPILKAVPYLTPDSVSMDLGAGNGLQCLLLWHLSPHARTIQVEISGRMVEAGRVLVPWVGVDPERVEWRIEDVTQTSLEGVDLLYLYRPLRPTGVGLRFYDRLAAELAAVPRPVTVVSVADCLRPLLPESFETVFFNGHITILRRE